MWIAIGGTAIVVLIAALTMLAIWVFSTEDEGDGDGEEEEVS